MSQQQNNEIKQHFFRASAVDFGNIPGSPIAYWLPDSVYKSFYEKPRFGDLAVTRKGLVTARNEVYVRYWYEVSLKKSSFKSTNRDDAKKSGMRWFPYIKGGEFRKWYGNRREVINWEGDGFLLQNTKHPTENRIWATNFNLDYIFRKNINWSDITGGVFSARISDGYDIFDATGLSCFPEECDYNRFLQFLNSKLSNYFLVVLNPTLHFQAGNIANLPAPERTLSINKLAELAISVSKNDWDSFECSWDFQSSPLIINKESCLSLMSSYVTLTSRWKKSTIELQCLEEENNEIFIDASCTEP